MTNPIFVFGSNLAGRHGKGAARDAMLYHGAEYGVGNGRTGGSYALPTKDGDLRTLALPVIRQYVEQFKKYAETHHYLRFQVTKIGCGLAGYQEKDIAPMFVGMPDNCDLPTGWREWR